MSFLDYLMGGAPAASAAAATVPPADAAAAGQSAVAAQTPAAPPADAQPQNPTPVSEVTVTAQRPPLHYDNTKDVEALHQGLAADAPTPGGTPGYNPGIWGLLPSNIQHGTMRNVLGGLGDAFLMMAHKPETYRPRMEQQLVGNAMAGYAHNPQAAIERVAGTGVPGSDQMAMNMENALENRKMREASLAQTNQWHQDTLAERQQYQNSQIEARNQSNLQRMIPYIGGLAQGATDKAGYQRVYNQAEAIAQRIGPNYHATDFGLPNVEDWQPGMTGHAGMTGNQITGDTTKRRGQDMTQQNAETAGQYRVRAAVAGAGARASAQPNSVAYFRQLNAKQQAFENGQGPPLTDDERNWMTKQSTFAKSGGAHRTLLTVPGGGQGGPQAAPMPQASDVQFVQHNPQYKQQFIAHFGKDVAARYGIR